VRNVCLLAVAVAAFARPVPAGDAAEVVVAGPLSEADGLTLGGRVEGGAAPVQVRIWRYVFDVNGRWSHDLDVEDARVGVVPPGGRFRFTGLPPGRYECDFGNGQLHWERRERTVELTRDVTDHVLVVPSNCRLKGHVTCAPVASKSRTTVSLGYWDVDVAEDGSFETPDVLPGAYRAGIRESWLAVPGPDVYDAIERSIPVTLGPGTTTLDVTLTPDVPLAVTVRSSRAGESIEGRFGATSGAVDWERGWFRVVPGDGGATQVQITRPTFPHGAAAWGPPGPAFLVGGLCAGRHRLRLTALGFEPWDQGVEARDGARVDVQMTALPGQFLEIADLPEVARVEVRSARGPWREIAAQDRRLVSMGADYEPSVVAFLPPGRHEWRADSLDGAPMPARELVTTDARTTVRLAPTFGTGRTLRGHLRSKSGSALRGVRVRVAVREEDGWRLVAAKDTGTDVRTGAFEVRGLSPGHWRAQLDDDGAVVLQEFDVGDADVTRDFRFVPR
jgi:hypothetical protein